MDVQRQRAGRLAMLRRAWSRSNEPILSLNWAAVGYDVARAGLIVTTDQVGIPANGVEHVAFPVMTAVAGF